jgi:hypothetical protein
LTLLDHFQPDSKTALPMRLVSDVDHVGLSLSLNGSGLVRGIEVLDFSRHQCSFHAPVADASLSGPTLEASPSTFSCDIAHAVCRDGGEGASRELPVQTTAGWLTALAVKA